MTQFQTVEQLQAEIERLREAVKSIGACAEVLGRYPHDLAVKINLLSVCRFHYEIVTAETSAALQPKEG